MFGWLFDCLFVCLLACLCVCVCDGSSYVCALACVFGRVFVYLWTCLLFVRLCACVFDWL